MPVTNLLHPHLVTYEHRLRCLLHWKEDCVVLQSLLDAQAHPEKYPQLTIRVSGYAVKFNSLTKEQQDDVISRTFHDAQLLLLGWKAPSDPQLLP